MKQYIWMKLGDRVNHEKRQEPRMAPWGTLTINDGHNRIRLAGHWEGMTREKERKKKKTACGILKVMGKRSWKKKAVRRRLRSSGFGNIKNMVSWMWTISEEW